RDRNVTGVQTCALPIYWIKLHGESFRDVRVLVTGGAGFIGSHVSEALTTLGANVVVLDDLSGSDGSNIEHLKNVERIKGSILDRSEERRVGKEERSRWG